MAVMKMCPNLKAIVATYRRSGGDALPTDDDSQARLALIVIRYVDDHPEEYRGRPAEWIPDLFASACETLRLGKYR